MIDFHSHILPGVDDGSKSVDETLKMLEIMASQGIKTVVATPHFYVNERTVDEFLQKRNSAYKLVMDNITNDNLPQIVLGAEVEYYSGISHFENLTKLTLQNSRLLLLEMPLVRWRDDWINEVCKISNFGKFTVVLAHIERYLKLQKPHVLNTLIQNGVLIQCNASFFASRLYSRQALKMLKKNQIHFLGTDCHNLTTRPPNMQTALNVIAKKFGNEFLNDFVYYGNELFLDNNI